MRLKIFFPYPQKKTLHNVAEYILTDIYFRNAKVWEKTNHIDYMEILDLVMNQKKSCLYAHFKQLNKKATAKTQY